jgi:simple sugar transport system permease protein
MIERRFFKIIIQNALLFLLVFSFLLSSIIFKGFFLNKYNLESIIFDNAGLALLVLAEAIVLISGNYDLSIESTLGISVMIGALSIVSWFSSIGYFLGITITLAIGTLIGLIIGYMVVKQKINSLLLTLSALIVLRGFMRYLTRDIVTVYGLPQEFCFSDFRTIFNIKFGVIVVIIIYIFFHLLMTKTRFGYEVFAIGGNKESAFRAGISVEKNLLIVYMLSGFISALAGLLMAGQMGCVPNSLGENMVFYALAGSVIGGVSLLGGQGSIIGVFGGFLFLALVRNITMIAMFSPYALYIMQGLLVFIAVLINSFRGISKNFKNYL